MIKHGKPTWRRDFSTVLLKTFDAAPAASKATIAKSLEYLSHDPNSTESIRFRNFWSEVALSTDSNISIPDLREAIQRTQPSVDSQMRAQQTKRFNELLNHSSPDIREAIFSKAFSSIQNSLSDPSVVKSFWSESEFASLAARCVQDPDPKVRNALSRFLGIQFHFSHHFLTMFKNAPKETMNPILAFLYLPDTGEEFPTISQRLIFIAKLQLQQNDLVATTNTLRRLLDTSIPNFVGKNPNESAIAVYSIRTLTEEARYPRFSRVDPYASTMLSILRSLLTLNESDQTASQALKVLAPILLEDQKSLNPNNGNSP